jgi:signal transduction histidine kinase
MASRVLHIEDDPSNRLLVRKLLAVVGLEVIDAADGLEGVRLALAERPDLILVDINLPGLDGYEVTLRLRAEAVLKETPIIAITAEGDRDTSMAVGCTGFLQKPIDARKFSAQVMQYLGGFRERTTSTVDATEAVLRTQGGRIVARLEAKVEELERTNARLRELDRLRTEFYRNMSHELATPMTPIVGYLRMLVDEELGPLDKPQKKALRAMDDCVRRLRTTLDNLIDVTAIETGRMRLHHRDFDLLEIVKRSASSLQDAMNDKRVNLIDEYPRGPLATFGDPDRLQRAILQILENAVKFTAESSHVGVCVRLVGDAYEITVADEGLGVDPTKHGQIFEPFVQGDGSATRTHGGVGVGLAIAKKVIEGHGGSIRIARGAIVGGETLSGAAFVVLVPKTAAFATRPPHG